MYISSPGSKQRAACVAKVFLSKTLLSSSSLSSLRSNRPPPGRLALHPCVIVLNGASSRLALPGAGGERGAAGAGGGVCCFSQSRLVFAAEPHMFTGSIPPVEPQLGRSRPRTGSRSSRSRSHPTSVFMCFQDIPKDRWVESNASGNNSTSQLPCCVAQVVFLRLNRHFVQSCANAVAVPWRQHQSAFSRRPQSSRGAVWKTNRSNGGRSLAGETRRLLSGISLLARLRFRQTVTCFFFSVL